MTTQTLVQSTALLILRQKLLFGWHLLQKALLCIFLFTDYIQQQQQQRSHLNLPLLFCVLPSSYLPKKKYSLLSICKLFFPVAPLIFKQQSLLLAVFNFFQVSLQLQVSSLMSPRDTMCTFPQLLLMESPRAADPQPALDFMLRNVCFQSTANPSTSSQPMFG